MNTDILLRSYIQRKKNSFSHRTQKIMHLNTWLLIQFGIIFILIVKVTSHTKSDKHCSFSQEELWLKIITGNKFFAGTDDDVQLFLLGANGIVCRANLDNEGNDRKRNHVDKYIICCPKGFLDNDREINMFTLTHMAYKGNKGGTSYNDWFIESIELGTGGKVILNYRLYTWTSSEVQGTVIFSKVDKNKYIRF